MNQDLKDSFDFTKKISDFVGMLVRLGIVLAFINFIYTSKPMMGQEFVYYTSLTFFWILYAILWLSLFRLFSDFVDSIMAAWMGVPFKLDVREIVPAAKGGQFRTVIAHLLSLVIFVLLHSGMEYGINAYVPR